MTPSSAQDSRAGWVRWCILLAVSLGAFACGIGPKQEEEGADHPANDGAFGDAFVQREAGFEFDVGLATPDSPKLSDSRDFDVSPPPDSAAAAEDTAAAEAPDGDARSDAPSDGEADATDADVTEPDVTDADVTEPDVTDETPSEVGDSGVDILREGG